ncbi:hypothetical protein [Herbaspirillum sp. YR522]|nr:hypothetical protein [Herbaspirillum sp. YR522]
MNWSALLFLLAIPMAVYAGVKPADVLTIALVAVVFTIAASGVLF